MTKDIIKDLGKKEKIINSAMNEFSKNGLKGSRVENIAKKANVNKAMIFYYFGSKKYLYELIVKKTVNVLLGRLSEIISPTLSIDDFIEKFPDIYINFFSQNKEFVNMIIIDLLQNPDFISDLIKELFKENFGDGPTPFELLVSKWYKQNLITEKNPVHFMMNILSLIIFPFILKPIPEALFNIELDETDEYYEYRKKSIKNLLKRGLLK